ncbi:hypothetical protein T4D_10589 [Trichinella pseudospiralis]|uniref:Uncharacterized protein n=1 Tax=Trichinella pseudospiralis TaxID=6337 RepID=A0A0V1FDJ6_TRIPS|nr:hypothetical protein T4D_10589 [Trichinella pseudospiralis]
MLFKIYGYCNLIIKSENFSFIYHAALSAQTDNALCIANPWNCTFINILACFWRNFILKFTFNDLRDLRNCRTSSSVCLFSLARIGQLTADMRFTFLHCNLDAWSKDKIFSRKLHLMDFIYQILLLPQDLALFNYF